MSNILKCILGCAAAIGFGLWPLKATEHQKHRFTVLFPKD